MTVDISTYARKGLEAELLRLDAERARVRSLLASLKSRSAPTVGGDGSGAVRRVRKMSEAGRQAIREAVQRRWARVRAVAAGAGQGSDAKAQTRTAVATSPKRPRTARAGNRKK